MEEYNGSSSARTSSILDITSFSLEEAYEDGGADVDMLERFDWEDLVQLRECFFNIGAEKDPSAPSFKGAPLTRDQFCRSIDTIIGSSTYTLAAGKLFDRIRQSKRKRTDEVGKEEVIWWEEILDAVIEKIEGDQDAASRLVSLKLIDETNLKLTPLPHSKREPVVKVVLLEEKGESFCYVAISKYGQVGVYDGRLTTLLESYRVQLGTAGARSASVWLNDALVLPDASAILIAASDRTLHFLNATGLAHTPLFLISGLPNSPQCLAYFPSCEVEPSSVLLFGDDQGDITTVRFNKPTASLFKRSTSTSTSDRSNTYFWRELESQSEWVKVTVDKGVHGDAVRQVDFLGRSSVLSCSSDPAATLIIRHADGRRPPYIFRINRGVRCFHLDRQLNLLVTGSTDNVVRLWNPVVTKSPVASLYGHKAAIVDVRLLAHWQNTISVSADGVVKVWDVEDQCCVQTLAIGTEAVGRALYPGPTAARPPAARQPKSSPRHQNLKPTHPADTSTLSSSLTTTSHSDLHNTLVRSGEGSSVDVNGEEWRRSQILMVCSNSAVLLSLRGADHLRGIDVDCQTLPPPNRQRDAMVPSPWLVHTDHSTTSSSSCGIERAISPSEEVISERALDFLRRSPQWEPNLRPMFRSTANPTRGLNLNRAQQKAHDKHMRRMVEQCAPHLALRLQQPEEVRVRNDLPMTLRMKSLGLDLSTPEKLIKAKLANTNTN